MTADAIDRLCKRDRFTHDWFAENPVWLAGMEGHEHAQRGCGYRSFTGGPILLTQYLGSDGFDANVACW